MFYDNLKQECEKQGLKITPVVQQCGGKVGSIGGWKNGASPNSDIVMKLAKRLNVSTDYLLFGESDEEPIRLTENEQILIKTFRLLNEIGQECCIYETKRILENVRYQKYTDISKEA